MTVILLRVGITLNFELVGYLKRLKPRLVNLPYIRLMTLWMIGLNEPDVNARLIAEKSPKYFASP